MNHSFRTALTFFTIALTAAINQAPGESAEPNQPPVESAATKPEAAGIGAWTTNYEAAVKVAQERKLPLFIQFTGSDWCGWCQKMEAECFSKPEFLDAMKTRCVLVVVDFPHKTELSAELKAQNNELATRFKKRGGFPCYYMVDADATTVHWSWGAHPKYGQDLKLLVSDIDNFFAGCACVVERATKDLPAEKADAYRKAAKAYAERQQSEVVWLDEKHPDTKAANEKFAADVEELKKLKAAMDTVLATGNPTTATR